MSCNLMEIMTSTIDLTEKPMTNFTNLTQALTCKLKKKHKKKKHYGVC